jgi:hypothetical protein
MQRRLLDAEREMISNFLKLHMTLTDCGLAASPLLATKMLVHNTTDGLPCVEPPLTDEDARQRPWVMVRDSEQNPWRGPFLLTYVAPAASSYPFSTVDPAVDYNGSEFAFARRATAEEIAAAGLEVAE